MVQRGVDVLSVFPFEPAIRGYAEVRLGCCFGFYLVKKRFRSFVNPEDASMIY